MNTLAAAVVVCLSAFSAGGERAATRDAVHLIELQAPVLMVGLRKSQNAIAWPEFNAISRLVRDDHIANMIYLNADGEIRWYKRPARDCDLCSVEELEFETKAPQKAFTLRKPVGEPTAAGLMQVAVPFVAGDRLLGVLIVNYEPDDWRRDLL